MVLSQSLWTNNKRMLVLISSKNQPLKEDLEAYYNNLGTIFYRAVKWVSIKLKINSNIFLRTKGPWVREDWWDRIKFQKEFSFVNRFLMKLTVSFVRPDSSKENNNNCKLRLRFDYIVFISFLYCFRSFFCIDGVLRFGYFWN